MPSRIRAALIAALAACALSGCGVNGKPEYPEGTKLETVTRPDGKDVKRPVRSTRPFVLDGLLN